MSRRTSGARRLPALLIGIAVCLAPLLAVEAWLRTVRFGAASLLRPLRTMAPAFGAQRCLRSGPQGELLTPNCRTWFRGTSVEINAAGIRDREVDERLPHYRIAVLGGSVTFGSGVAERELYHARLEDRLAAELGAPGFVELYNYGREWWSTADNLRDLERLLRTTRIDAVLAEASPADLLFLTLGDATCRPGDTARLASPAERAFYDREIRGKSWAWSLFDALERASGLWAFERAKTIARFVSRSHPLPPEQRARLAALEEKGRRLFRSCAERLREVASQHGSELAWIAIWYVPDPKTALLVRELRALGEPVLSMEDVTRDLPGPGPYTVYPGDVHPNAAVHGVYAERLHRFLDEQGWLARIRAAQRERSATPTE